MHAKAPGSHARGAAGGIYVCQGSVVINHFSVYLGIIYYILLPKLFIKSVHARA